MKTILLTRPLKESLDLANQLKISLRERGVSLLIQPLFRIDPLPFHGGKIFESNPPLASLELIFTSRHGVRFFAQSISRRDLTVWCVGQQTAHEAKTHGFPTIHVANNNAASLKEMIINQLTDNAFFYYFSAKEVSLDFETELPKGRCKRIPLYEAVPIQNLRPTITRAFENNTIDIISVFSMKTATLLREKMILPSSVVIFAISAKVAALFPDHSTFLFKNEDDMVRKIKLFLNGTLLVADK